jgi:hypothetical protein
MDMSDIAPPPVSASPVATAAKGAEPPRGPYTTPEAGANSLPRATCPEKAAWILVAAGLLFILHFKLVPALVAGLCVYGLIHALTARLAGSRLSHSHARIVVVSLLGLAIVGVVAALSVLLAAFLKGRLGDLPALLDKMAAVLEDVRNRLGGMAWIPAAENLRGTVTTGLRDHARELQQVGGDAGRALMHALVGIVIGALASFETRRPEAPLPMALAERVQRLAGAFEKVVLAQGKISTLNTLLAGLYLLIALPLFGVELPLRKTLVVVTFLAKTKSLPDFREALRVFVGRFAGARLAADYSSRVDRSPSGRPWARAFRTRRMILPERVLGRASTKATSSGRAMGPICCDTCWRSSSAKASEPL